MTSLFSGALIAGDLADRFGRRITIIAGCVVYTVGVILQTASHGLALIVVGRIIAGIGVGFVSAIMYVLFGSYSFLLLIAFIASCTCQKFAHERSEVPSSLATNSASRSVSSWLPASPTPPKTVPTLALTEFPSEFSLPGV